MKKITDKTTLKELAFIVCSCLKENGIDTVLTGGAVVSIYTENQYESFDLDFITHSTVKDVTESLKKIGFERSKGRYYLNPDSDYYLEFPSPPLAVGNKPLKQFNEINTTNGYLKLLTPTQCVMDRLAAFYHWNDFQTLEQALLVANAHDINFKEVEDWSQSEGMLEKYNHFKEEFNKVRDE